MTASLHGDRRAFGLAACLATRDACARVSAASLADHRCIGPHCPVCEAMGAFRRIEDRVAADVRRACIAARCEAERVHAWISRIASSAAFLTPVSQGTRLIV